MCQLCLNKSGGEKWDLECSGQPRRGWKVVLYIFPEVGFKKRNHVCQIGVTRVLHDFGCSHPGKFSTQSCVFKLLFGGGFIWLTKGRVPSFTLQWRNAPVTEVAFFKFQMNLSYNL